MADGRGNIGGKGAMIRNGTHNHNASVVFSQAPGQSVLIRDNKPVYRDKTQRMAVPAMPMPAAIICCILNFLIPGFGTICAGFSSCCCSRNEDIDQGERCVSVLIGWAIGCAQFWSCVFFFVGWFWSCAWGVFFIGMSAEYYHSNKIAPGAEGYVNRSTNGGVTTTILTNQPSPSQLTATFIAQPTDPALYYYRSRGPPSHNHAMPPSPSHAF